jgi:hypothetical protein
VKTFRPTFSVLNNRKHGNVIRANPQIDPIDKTLVHVKERPARARKHVPADAAAAHAGLVGRAGAERAATQLNVPYLGELSTFPELRVNSDAGKPHANFEANPKLRDALDHIVKKLAGEVSVRNLKPAGPEFTIT